MASLKEIYRKNILAIIGTLIFHIILISIFLIAGVDTSGHFKEEGIVIDFEEIEEPPLPTEEQLQNNVETIEAEEANYQQSMSNRAVNTAAPKTDEILNDEFMREIEAAQKLAQDVSNQLQKEMLNIDDIEMPAITNQDTSDQEQKNVINFGESRNSYNLENRHHIKFFIPTYLAQKGGVITVDIQVARNGKVTFASVRQKEKYPQLAQFARAAALKTRFNKDLQAPSKQKGTITYTFVAQ